MPFAVLVALLLVIPLCCPDESALLRSSLLLLVDSLTAFLDLPSDGATEIIGFFSCSAATFSGSSWRSRLYSSLQ